MVQISRQVDKSGTTEKSQYSGKEATPPNCINSSEKSVHIHTYDGNRKSVYL